MARRELELGNRKWRLFRLADDEFARLGRNAVHIGPDRALATEVSCLGPRRQVSLGRAFVALERMFGPRSMMFDPWKGSFAFPLLLRLPPGRGRDYLVMVHDRSGGIEYPLARILSSVPIGREASRYHPPVDAEFPRAEIWEFTVCLHDCIVAYGQGLDRHPPKPFVHMVRDEPLLYGYDGNGFFERSFDALEDWEHARCQLEDTLQAGGHTVDTLIQRIAGA